MEDGLQLMFPLMGSCVQVVVIDLQNCAGPGSDVLVACKEDTVRVVLANLLFNVVESNLLQLPRRSWIASNDGIGNIVMQRCDVAIATSMRELRWIR